MKSYHKKWLIAAFATFAIILGGLFLFYKTYAIQRVVVDGKKDINGISLLKQKNIVFLDIKKTEEILFEANPTIASITIEKSYPSTLEIYVEDSVATAILPVGNGFFVLSTKGRILEKNRTNTTHLPIINYYQKLPFQGYESGDIVSNSDILLALALIEKVSYLAIVTDGIDIKGLDMIVLKKGSVEYIFTTQKSAQEQYDDLKIIIEKFKLDGKEYKSIDLRFDKPIIKI
jgi:hypothetical protein